MINFVKFRNSHYWKRNLGGLFVVGGRQLTDAEARKVVNYAIEHGYMYSSDIPDSEVASVLGWT
jgi:hypothetical protein|nr:MAG TPA: hypothetical protein [Caudoviricetes sp.]